MLCCLSRYQDNAIFQHSKLVLPKLSFACLEGIIALGYNDTEVSVLHAWRGLIALLFTDNRANFTN